jgi:hypothetical protein
MPQTTYLPIFTTEYPILAKAQKPGGVTVLAAVSAGDVPNKHVPFTVTIQSTEQLLAEAEATTVHQGENPGEEEEHEEEVDDGNGGKVKKKSKKKSSHSR